MTNDYIRREDAVYVINCKCYELKGLAKNITKGVQELPPADVAPVVHSRWEYKCGEIRCPECGNRIHRIDLSGCLNFCPNCGAKMDGEE